MRKKRILLIGGSLLFLLFTTGSVSAYLIDADQIAKGNTIGGNTAEIIDEYQPPTEIYPGMAVARNVRVKNLGSSNCFVRMKAVFKDSDVGECCTVNWNEKDWSYENGYWYHRSSVGKEKQTSSLFTTISINKQIPEAKGNDIDMLLYMETYQQGMFGDTEYQAAWEKYQENRP